MHHSAAQQFHEAEPLLHHCIPIRKSIGAPTSHSDFCPSSGRLSKPFAMTPTELQAVAHRKLAGSEREPITMIDDLLTFCAETGFVGGRQENDHAIIFEMVDGSEVQLELVRAQGAFRTMCARLCKISNDLNPALDNIYRGVATMPYGAGAIRIECENRLAKHYFKLKYLANQASAGDCAVAPSLHVESSGRAAPDRQR